MADITLLSFSKSVWINSPGFTFPFFSSYNDRQKRLRNYIRHYWGVSPKNISWYEKALRHKSLVGSGKFDHADCNERLELLGDAVLDTVITEYLFKRYPESDEGQLTKARARIVNRQTLSQAAKAARLDDVIEARIGNVDSMDKIMGNALEAFIGAIYIDRGFRNAKLSIEQHLITRHLNVDFIVENAVDFKSSLIEWAQQKKSQLRFLTLSSEHDDQSFICSIIVDQVLIAKGEDRSKKKAEQAASKFACEKLGV